MTSNIRVPRTARCAFCDYLSGQRSYTVMHRTSNAAALVTREQRGVGHVLVSPIAHRETLLDLTPTESIEIMHLIVSLARAIDRAMRPEGIAVWQNNGVPAEQTIPHVHFHIAGTYPGRGTDRGHVPELSLRETERIGEVLQPWL